MSRATMTAAAASFPRSPVFGIASCPVGTETLEFEIGWDEFERDLDWAETLLRSAGIGAGDKVLTTLNPWEGPWTTPVVRALQRIGAVNLPAEVWPFDYRRTSMFLQRLEVKAIFGLCGDTLTGLEQEEPSVAELLRNVDILWARPDALPKLADVAPQVLLCVMLGPALGLGLPGKSGVVVNGAEWTVDTDGDELVVSNARERLATFEGVRTGYRGSVSGEADGALTIDLAPVSGEQT
jgi:hypothetical protein